MENWLWNKLGVSSNFRMEERLFLSSTILSALFIFLLSFPFYIANSGMAPFYFLLLSLGMFISYLMVRIGSWFWAARILNFILTSIFAIILFPLSGYYGGPVIYALFIYLPLAIISSSKLWEQRLAFLHTILLIGYLCYLGRETGSQYAAWLHFLIFLFISVIFYLGSLFLKYNLDKFIRQSKEEREALVSLNAQMEKQTIETKELNAQKDRLFSIIGHDLRSPLSGIEGFLNVLDHGGVPDNERKIMQNELLRLTRNSRQLLDNLLQWAKRDTKAYQASAVDYPVLIKKVGEQLKPLADAKGVKLQVLIDEGEGTVTGDADMLEMVIRNLISNSIKFTAKGGWIKLRAYELEKELRLEVEDNGVGMTEKQRDKLFSPYREVGIGTNREKGVGLGLMLCAEFLTYMNGSIEVRSVIEKGSCFTVHLPRAARTDYPS